MGLIADSYINLILTNDNYSQTCLAGNSKFQFLDFSIFFNNLSLDLFGFELVIFLMNVKLGLSICGGSTWVYSVVMGLFNP